MFIINKPKKQSINLNLCYKIIWTETKLTFFLHNKDLFHIDTNDPVNLLIQIFSEYQLGTKHFLIEN